MKAFQVIRNQLTSLSVLDQSGVISLTNVAVLASFLKLFIAPSEGYTDVALVALALFNYGHKRVEAGKIKYKELDNQTSRVETVIKELNSSIKVLQDNAEATNKILSEDRKAISIMEEQLQDQSKVVEEAKTMLQATKVASTFKRHQL